MNRSIFLSIILAVSLLLCCQQNKNVKLESTTVDTLPNTSDGKRVINHDSVIITETVEPPFSLNSFKKIPGEIEGCACFFSGSLEQMRQNEYLFVANFDSTAYITVNRKLVKLRLISTTREPGTFGDNDHKEFYGSEEYLVTVDIKYNKATGDETWSNTGTIVITGKEGRKTLRQFYGGCGC